MANGPTDQEALELPSPVTLHPDCPEVPPVPQEAVDQPRAVRRYYITASDLTEYGYTEGCPACDATRAGLPRTGILHSPGCRERIEAAVAADPAAGCQRQTDA